MARHLGRWPYPGMAFECSETDAQLVDSLSEVSGAVGVAGDVALDSRKGPLNSVEPVTQLLPQARQQHHRR
jgi:hypothetical protein